MTAFQEHKPGTNAMDITPDKDGGAMKELVKEGEGEDIPYRCDDVFIHYESFLEDGTKIDSSREREQPFVFTLGEGEVVRGWDLCVATMKKNEKAILTCKPEYAYGETGKYPVLPANATIRFEMELCYWKGQDLSPEKDGTIIAHYVEKNSKGAYPNDGAEVDIHLCGKYDGRIFEDRDVNFLIGEGSDFDLCPGIEMTLTKLRFGDRVKLELQPVRAFGLKGKPEWDIPPHATVEYEVTLKNVKLAKEAWTIKLPEKFEESASLKERGGTFYKQEKFQLAAKQYSKIINFLKFEDVSGTLEGEDKEKREYYMLTCYLNLAACYLKLDENLQAEENATRAMDFDPKNEKAYFRRAQARFNMGEYQKAKSDYAMVTEINPENKTAASQISACGTSLKKQIEKEKNMYGNMFNRTKDSAGK